MASRDEDLRLGGICRSVGVQIFIRSRGFGELRLAESWCPGEFACSCWRISSTSSLPVTVSTWPPITGALDVLFIQFFIVTASPPLPYHFASF